MIKIVEMPKKMVKWMRLGGGRGGQGGRGGRVGQVEVVGWAGCRWRAGLGVGGKRTGKEVWWSGCGGGLSGGLGGLGWLVGWAGLGLPGLVGAGRVGWGCWGLG